MFCVRELSISQAQQQYSNMGKEKSIYATLDDGRLFFTKNVCDSMFF